MLTPDFHAKAALVSQVVGAAPEVFAHNIETVQRLSTQVRPQASYETSLETLKVARSLAPKTVRTKSGLMVGLGEEPQEVIEAMQDLKAVGCEILTIGQYLQPTPKQWEVREFVTPEQFEMYREQGLQLGFRHVASGPYVRSSYNAFEGVR